MTIDAKTGLVTLSSGFAFDSRLTQAEFEKQGLHDPAKMHNPGTPWYYHPFTDGEVESHPLLATLCFYRNVLVSFSFLVDLYPAGPRTWDDYSLATEEKMQVLHAKILRQWLGAPHQTLKLPSSAKEHPAMNEALRYKFDWGQVWCSHDPRSGTTDAGIRYTKNDEWAREDYKNAR